MLEKLFNKLNLTSKSEHSRSSLSEISNLYDYGSYTYRNYTWFNDEELMELYEKFGLGRPSFVKDRYLNLYYLSKLAKGIQGDTVECGVYTGFGSFIMMNALSETEKIHHIFDSFEGLSHPTDKDFSNKAVLNWKKGDLAVAEDTVRSNLKGYNIELHKGWIPEKFNLVESKKFSLVHIDVDLYQPTLDSLTFFYERLEKGALMICDDYGSTSCPGAKMAFDEFMHNKIEDIIKVNTCQAYIIKK